MHITKPSRSYTLLMLAMLILLGSCATKAINHLPRQELSIQAMDNLPEQGSLGQSSSGQSFPMQYLTLHVESSVQAMDIKLSIQTRILTETLPAWATHLDKGYIVIYLINAKNTVIATHNYDLPMQNLVDVADTLLNIHIPLEKKLTPTSTLSIAFGYRLAVSNAEGTRRIVLTEAAAEK